jgi:hypothetical protein
VSFRFPTGSGRRHGERDHQRRGMTFSPGRSARFRKTVLHKDGRSAKTADIDPSPEAA